MPEPDVAEAQGPHRTTPLPRVDYPTVQPTSTAHRGSDTCGSAIGRTILLQTLAVDSYGLHPLTELLYTNGRALDAW